MENTLEYIKNLSQNASIVINQDDKDWLATISQITNPVLSKLNTDLLVLQNNINSKYNTLEKSIVKSKNSVLDTFNSTISNYATKEELALDNNDCKQYTDEQLRTSLFHYVTWDALDGGPENRGYIEEILENYYDKSFLDTKFIESENNILNTISNNYYNKSYLNGTINLINTRIDNIVSDYVKNSNINEIIENNVQNIELNNYYTKTEIDNLVSTNNNNLKDEIKGDVLTTLTPDVSLINKKNESDNPFEDGYITRYEHNIDMNDVKSYIDEQLRIALAHYVRKDEFDKKIRIIENTANRLIQNSLYKYYTKSEIDKKFEDIGNAYVQIISPREYQLLKQYGKIKDNNIYLVQKYGRPVSLYIGKLLFAKRDDDLAIGFPYTFPLVF